MTLMKTEPEATVPEDSDLSAAGLVHSDGVNEGDTASQADEPSASSRGTRGRNWRRAIAYGLIPALALLFAVVAAYLKWESGRYHAIDRAATESVAAAQDTAVAMLSYQPDTAERDLGAAADRMTGDFRASYLKLVNDVVIPGAKQQKISIAATVKAAASVTAEPDHATVLLFIDQNVVTGQDPPAVSASCIRVSLDKVGDRWLVAAFDPV